MVLPVAAVSGFGLSSGKAAQIGAITAAASAIAPFAQAAGAGVSAIGAVQSGRAGQQQAQFQANVLRQQAERDRLEADQRSEDFARRTSMLEASRRALLGGSGVDPSEGSPLLTSEDFAAEAELNRLRILAGGDVVSNRLQQQADLTKFSGRQAKQEGFSRGGALLLSGVGKAFS